MQQRGIAIDLQSYYGRRGVFKVLGATDGSVSGHQVTGNREVNARKFACHSLYQEDETT
jgi:hypothetical protein